MSSLIYFGSKPGSNALVSEENRSRKINFCRAVPGALNIVGTKDFTHPSYELFLNYLPIALYAARTATPRGVGTTAPFYNYNGKNVPSYCADPTIVWTYGEKKPSDFLDQQKSRFNAIETTAGGKPALSARLTVSQVRNLIKDTDPLKTTNISTNTVNLEGYFTYRNLHALSHALLRLFQYPLTEKTSKLAVDRAVAMVAVPNDQLQAPTGWTTHKVFKHDTQNVQFHMNLPTPYATHNHVISNAADIPNGDGLIFPFVPSLARDDPATIPSILSGPLNGLFGSDSEENGARLKSLIEGWAKLHITPWGHELTHVFIGIRLAMETGAGIRTFVTPQGVYAGFILTGSYFNVFVNGESFDPQSFATLQKDFAVASPHSAALTSLFALINFADDMERQRELAAVRSLYDVSVRLRGKGYNINDKENIAKYAARLSFVKDKYLTLNGTNLARVLVCANTGIGESEIPLHHLAIFSTNRTHRLLSAFGASCPSFIIEGGRSMSLTGTFSIKKTMKVKGKSMEVQINTMYCAVKPFEAACNDMDRVLRDKEVMTIAGTPNATRVSAKAMIREFDGNHGTEVLAALRAVAQVVVLNEPGVANQKKRKAEKEASAEGSKKARATFEDI